MTRRAGVFAALAAAVVLATAAPARAQASLSKAKELYAAASYDEALTMLNALGSSADRTEDAAAVEMYRVLCLVAVGRTGEVDAAIERLVSQHPLYRPPSEELSPRMRTAINSARLRMLPVMVQRRYEESKSAYDKGDYSEASTGFKWVLTALADPDISGLAQKSPLADIKTLSSGFVDLAATALAPPPPVPIPAPAPPPVVAAPVIPAPPARDMTRVFSAEDSDVVAPVTVRQSMPRFPGVLTVQATGVLELVVDAAGAVESVRLIESVHPQYDSLLLSAAKRWQYQPAQLDGTRVRYIKRIQISLEPAERGAGR